MCRHRMPEESALKLQYGHSKGFSPVCVRMCSLSRDGIGDKLKMRQRHQEFEIHSSMLIVSIIDMLPVILIFDIHKKVSNIEVCSCGCFGKLLCLDIFLLPTKNLLIQCLKYLDTTLNTL